VEQIPLTAVGKIAKLPLAYAEIQDVFAGALAAVEGVAHSEVEVVSDRRLGVVARVKVKPLPGVAATDLMTRAQQAVGQFPVRSEVHIEGAGQ
jgi:hypothetical protein